jgi:hypothetical protein
MEFDFSDIDALGTTATPKRMEFDFSAIDAMGNTPVPATLPPPALPEVALPTELPSLPTADRIVGTPEQYTSYYPAGDEFIPQSEPETELIPQEVQLPRGKTITGLGDALNFGFYNTSGNVKGFQADKDQYREENPVKHLGEMLMNVLGGGLPSQHLFLLPKGRREELREEATEDYKKSIENGVPLSFTQAETFEDHVNYVKGLIGSSAPQMVGSILSGGTMTPLLLSAELNQGLSEIKDLPLEKKMALAQAGGLVAAALENLGLVALVKGIPKEWLGQMGLPRIVSYLERALVTSATEATTETAQEGTFIVSEYLADKNFQPGEIALRLKESAIGGGILGGGLGSVAKVAQDVLQKKPGGDLDRTEVAEAIRKAEETVPEVEPELPESVSQKLAEILETTTEEELVEAATPEAEPTELTEPTKPEEGTELKVEEFKPEEGTAIPEVQEITEVTPELPSPDVQSTPATEVSPAVVQETTTETEPEIETTKAEVESKPEVEAKPEIETTKPEVETKPEVFKIEGKTLDEAMDAIPEDVANYDRRIDSIIKKYDNAELESKGMLEDDTAKKEAEFEQEAEIVVEEEEETEEIVPKAIVKEEAEQGIETRPDAKEGEPGYKRKIVPGSNRKVITPEANGMEVSVQTVVVERSELVEAEGKFQIRDRDRQHSENLARTRAEKFDAAQVTERSRTSDAGPPIMLPSGVVLSGNGRVLTIKQLYDNPEFAEQKEAYLASIEKQIQQSGKTFEQPILVQRLVTKDLTREQIVEFGKRSNISKADTLSATERAESDAQKIPDFIHTFVDSDVAALRNADFVKAFVEANVAENEQGEFFQEDGKSISSAGVRRVQAALLSAAYGKSENLLVVLESTKDEVKAISNSLLEASPRFADLKAGIKKSIVPQKMDITASLIDAVEAVRDLRQRGKKAKEYFDQVDLTRTDDPIRDTLIRAMYHDDLKRARSQKHVANVLKNYVDSTLEQDYTEGLPGIDAAPSSASEILERSIKKETKGETDAKRQNENPLVPDGTTAESSGEGSTGVRRSGVPESGRADKGSTEETEDFSVVPEAVKVKPEKPPQKFKPGTITEEVTAERSASINEQIYADMAESLPDPDSQKSSEENLKLKIAVLKNKRPEAQVKQMQQMVKEKFGLRFVETTDEKITDVSLNNMMDAYTNLQGMAASLGLPLQGIGLDGTLGLSIVDKKGKYLGMFSSAAEKPTEAPGAGMEAPYISVAGRANVFAHEYGHALDYHILSNLSEGWHRGMSGLLRGDSEAGTEIWLSDNPAEKVKYAFAEVINSIFFEDGAVAAEILALEQQLEKSKKWAAKRGNKPPPATIAKAEEQIERLMEGISRRKIPKSNYKKLADSFGNTFGNKDYWPRPTEMFARAFEAYVAHLVETQKAGGTEFLSMPDYVYQLKKEDVSGMDVYLSNLFPKESERLNIFTKFNALFSALNEEMLIGEAAKAPGEGRVIEWASHYKDPKHFNLFSKEAKAETDRKLRAHKRQLERELDRPVRHEEKSKKDQLIIKIQDQLMHPLLSSKRANLLDMAHRYRNNGKTQPAFNYIIKQLIDDPGGERPAPKGGTFTEASRRVVRQRSHVFKEMLNKHNASLFSDEDMKNLQLLLTSDPATITKAQSGKMNADVITLAGDLRNLLNQLYHYTKKGHVEINFLSENSYLPRVLDTQLVFHDQQGFTEKATALYKEVLWVNDHGEFEPSSLEQLLSVGKVARRKMFRLMDIDAINKIAAIAKRVGAIQKEIEFNNDPDNDVKDAETKNKELKTQIENILQDDADAIFEGHNELRDAWSDFGAEDWNKRIHELSGEDPSAHSPMGQYTKKRKLPKEADTYMADFYTDPVDAIGKYISSIVRKTEFEKRFGSWLVPEGKKKSNATGEPRNYLEYLLQEKLSGEVYPEEVINVRRDAMSLMGMGGKTVDTIAQKGLNKLHSIAIMSMLTKAAVSSIAEPFVAGIKTRSVLKGAKAFALTAEELLTYVSKDREQNVQKRKQVANILGVVDDPEIGEMVANRLGGMLMDDPNTAKKMSRFFVITGLQGLTNAQRRAVMLVGFQFIRELSVQYKQPVGETKQAIADNKKEAELELQDLGVSIAEMGLFTDYYLELTDNSILPSAEALLDTHGELSDMSEMLSVVVGRIVNRSIQDPEMASKPRYAETPLGRFVYSIQSFNYSFARNVLIAETKRLSRTKKHFGSKKAMLDAVNLIGPVFQLYAGHFLVSTAREFLTKRDRWEEEKEKGNLEQYLAEIAFSRTGALGAADPLYQAVRGVRYQRDLANLGVGATGAFWLQPIEKLIRASQKGTNSPKTLNAELGAAKGIYQLAVIPFIVTMASNPAFLSSLGPFQAPVAGAVAVAGASQTSRDYLSRQAVEILYGEEVKKKKRGKRR